MCAARTPSATVNVCAAYSLRAVPSCAFAFARRSLHAARRVLRMGPFVWQVQGVARRRRMEGSLSRPRRGWPRGDDDASWVPGDHAQPLGAAPGLAGASWARGAFQGPSRAQGETDEAALKAQSGRAKVAPADGGGGKGGGKKGDKGKVTIELSSRNKRKHLTSVRGLEAFGIDMRAAAKVFGKKARLPASTHPNARGHARHWRRPRARQFASGSAFEKGKHGQPDAIEIQGDWMHELPDFLCQKYPEVVRPLLRRGVAPRRSDAPIALLAVEHARRARPADAVHLGVRFAQVTADRIETKDSSKKKKGGGGVAAAAEEEDD